MGISTIHQNECFNSFISDTQISGQTSSSDTFSLILQPAAHNNALKFQSKVEVSIVYIDFNLTYTLKFQPQSMKQLLKFQPQSSTLKFQPQSMKQLLKFQPHSMLCSYCRDWEHHPLSLGREEKHLGGVRVSNHPNGERRRGKKFTDRIRFTWHWIPWW